MRNARKTFLPFALPSISEEAIDEVTQVLRSGWITSGPKVKQFEQEFGKFIGASQAIAVNSATAGLHLALEAIGFDQNSAAITTSVTFTATAEVVCYFGGEPILTDVDPLYNNMDSRSLELSIKKFCYKKNNKLYSKKTKKLVRAVIPVHIAGATCDLESISAIAKKYGLYVIEDAAHAFPAIHKEQFIGTNGDFTVFSFYATKGITTGEGGMVTTPHSQFADRIRRTRLHGINKESFDRPSWYYEVTDAGYKYNMTDISAALGLVQLKEANGFWNRRREIANQYIQEFQNIPGLQLPSDFEWGSHSWHLFRIELDPSLAKVGRDTLCVELKDRNIGSSLHFIPIFEHSFYRKQFDYNREDYPNACKMYDRCLSLPLFAGMTNDDVSDVIRSVKEILY
ncbi:DegT/DnrJ/EryC1/StrS family aminotransferase [Leptospira sp. GIMC2001]|uniref:DegT/DnrJ/EryC1/StrS family aminotransferase n=1 Tax=Leptospira sp. GIMC2001 TaxID=1513297 RepID=UPI00234BEA8C|nr:DegT/DnrJ/EryC1/StrS aminotransferase family protein [Leptospira sp. GIMC2001]WCL51421.1 DegT/DnrJ/EryC1/StrS aminotransferase family protein [Leptospira sp. GIMC2001]